MGTGDPMREDTYIGAIARAPQLDLLDAQLADAVATLSTYGSQAFTRSTAWHLRQP